MGRVSLCLIPESRRKCFWNSRGWSHGNDAAIYLTTEVLVFLQSSRTAAIYTCQQVIDEVQTEACVKPGVGADFSCYTYYFQFSVTVWWGLNTRTTCSGFGNILGTNSRGGGGHLGANRTLILHRYLFLNQWVIVFSASCKNTTYKNDKPLKW